MGKIEEDLKHFAGFREFSKGKDYILFFFKKPPKKYLCKPFSYIRSEKEIKARSKSNLFTASIFSYLESIEPPE